MQLDVPFYAQTTSTTCWYHCIKMIRHYHEYGAAPQEKMNAEGHLQKVKDVHSKTDCDEIWGPLVILPGAGLNSLLKGQFNTNSTGTDVEKLLLEHGPLFIPCWQDRHARVLVGVEPNACKGGWPDEEWMLFAHDPGMKDGAYVPVGLRELMYGEKASAEVTQPEKYLGWDKKYDPDTNNLWYFMGKASEKKAKQCVPRKEQLKKAQKT